MATEVIMPKVDMVMETGTFLEWLVEEGDEVKKGDPLFVINTEKAAIEVESPEDGILAGVRAKRDDVIPVTEVIGYIIEPGESLPEKQDEITSASAPQHTEEAVKVEQKSQKRISSEKVRATPLARRVANELKVDLHLITGCGPNGRIHKSDVLAFYSTLSSDGSAGQLNIAGAEIVVPAINLPNAQKKQIVPLSGARKIIAERMAYSASTIPHINLSLRVDMSEVIRLREHLLEPLQSQTGQRVSITAILAYALAVVLPRHPFLNASLSEENIILWDDIHLGIAMRVEENLIVPVIPELQKKGLEQIVTSLGDMTKRGRNRQLLPSEMTGSTFTISNLGMYGIETFTAIINPPESAILAVGAIVDTPVQKNGRLEFRPMVQFTLSADHRVVDGATVAEFLSDFKTSLENPYSLSRF